MVSTTGCTVTSVICASFRQILGPDHRKCEGPIVIGEMRPGSPTRKHDWGIGATQCYN
jgi:hypothetical protein